MSEALERADSMLAMTPSEVKGQVQLIQQIMQGVMQREVHFDVIPGCGDKPVLLLPGAQKIALAFRLVPEYIVEREDLPGGHREYEVQCFLATANGFRVGHGIGNCSTMETKYRFRQQVVGDNVPEEYWQTRNKELIGGDRFDVQKRDGKWRIVERVEAPNPADYYNTVKKMAAKRAYVHAVIQATAASDLFTQDIEEDPDAFRRDESPEERREPPPAPRRRAPAQDAPPRTDSAPPRPSGAGRPITEKQVNLVHARLKRENIDNGAFHQLLRDEYGVEHIKDIPGDALDDILDRMQGLPRAAANGGGNGRDFNLQS